MLQETFNEHSPLLYQYVNLLVEMLKLQKVWQTSGWELTHYLWTSTLSCNFLQFLGDV